jgi:hypothetical protein
LFGNLVSCDYNIIFISNDAVSLSKGYRTVESTSCIWVSSAFIKIMASKINISEQLRNIVESFIKRNQSEIIILLY